MDLRDELRAALAGHMLAKGVSIHEALRDATANLIHLSDEQNIHYDEVSDDAWEVYAQDTDDGEV